MKAIYKASNEIFRFYLKLIFEQPATPLLLVSLGFLLRASSVVIFALTIKAFLVVLDPTIINHLFHLLFGQANVEQSTIDKLLPGIVLVLAGMVALQFLLNTLYLRAFIKHRRNLVERFAEQPIFANLESQKHICLDLIPVGYESLIKVLEITLFYLSLCILIFILNPVIGFIVVPILMAILLYMLLFVIERKSARAKAYKERQDVSADALIDGLQFADHSFTTLRRNTTYSEFFGGLGMVLLMAFYLLFMDITSFAENKLFAFVLILSVRFLVNYTGEFSRLLGVILSHHTMLAKLQYNNNNQ